MEPPVLALEQVTFRREGRTVLDGVEWRVERSQHWAVLGPNGCGKSTLLRLVSFYEHPSSGTVEVLGGRLGTVDIRSHRRRIGIASAAIAGLIRPEVRAVDVVMTAANAALEPWWHRYTDEQRERAAELLERHGVADRSGDPFGRLSSGERQRVLLARAEWGDPGLVLLDEPTAGLDLGGREELVAHLGALAQREAAPTMVLVTHHVEEIPAGCTHLLALRSGRVVAAGPVGECLTAALLAELFGVRVELTRSASGRFSAVG